jgi:hypothetical protein
LDTSGDRVSESGYSEKLEVSPALLYSDDSYDIIVLGGFYLRNLGNIRCGILLLRKFVPVDVFEPSVIFNIVCSVFEASISFSDICHEQMLN